MSGSLKFAAVLLVASTGAFAAQVPLTPSNVIGGSGSYGGEFNAGQYNALQILDDQSAIVTEPNQAGFWLNPDGGPANAYITVDLGAYYHLSRFDLFNAHNATFNDRGTGAFNITASRSIVNTGLPATPTPFNYSLGGSPTQVASGTLLPSSSAVSPTPAQPFTVSDPGVYRYVRFNPTSVATSGGSCCGANNYALNELRAFGTTNRLSLQPSNVIGGSGSYGGTYNIGQFNATQILDKQSGTVSEPTSNGFWLNPDNGPANAYIVIDLGAEYNLEGVELFNAHNSGSNDRGTGQFQILGSATADFVNSTVGSDLSGAQTLMVNGTMDGVTYANDPIVSQYFDSLSGAPVRYLRINPQSVAAGGTSCCGENNFGLDEIRVYATPVGVPEPASAMLIALVGAGLLGRRRIRS